MTLLDILTQALAGKKFVGGNGPVKMVGSTIVNVQLNSYEPIFELVVRQPNGAIEVWDFLDEWDIIVE